jgi:hypothetical protein
MRSKGSKPCWRTLRIHTTMHGRLLPNCVQALEPQLRGFLGQFWQT